MSHRFFFSLVSCFQSTERDDPSRVSEDADAILDSLFNACDTERTGQVSVSRLIEYLRNAISNGTEEVSLVWTHKSFYVFNLSMKTANYQSMYFSIERFFLR